MMGLLSSSLKKTEDRNRVCQYTGSVITYFAEPVECQNGGYVASFQF